MGKVTEPKQRKARKGDNADLVRVEDSIEDFILDNLPRRPGTERQVCPLFKDKAGGDYFRVKYWKYDKSSMVVTRREVASSFVIVREVEGKRTLTEKIGDHSEVIVPS